MRWALFIAALLAGCASVGAGSTRGLVQASSSTGTATFGVALGLTIILLATYQGERGSSSSAVPATRPQPDLDPARTVGEQDCTKPLDESLGNIRCK